MSSTSVEPAGPGVPTGRAAPTTGAVPTGRAVRLTRRGLGLLLATVGSALLTVVLGYRELTLLAAAGATALLSALLAVARRVPLVVELRLDHPHVQRGDPACLTVAVANDASRRTPPVVVTVARAVAGTGSVAAGGSSSGPGVGARRVANSVADSVADSVAEPVASMSPGSVGVPALGRAGRLAFKIGLDTSSRGVVEVGPVALRRTDRFGLLVRAAAGGELIRLHVWPRPRGIAPLPSPRSRDAGGPANDGAPGGVMFSSLREYAPGDDLRRVHWPSSARRGELLVREHADPSEPVSTVLLDTRPAGYPAGPAGDVAFDEAVDVAASVVLASTRSRSPVRLVTTSGLSVVGRRRQADAATFLDALAVVTRDETASLDVIATSRRGGVGTLTVVTGTTEAGQLAAVAPVVHRFEQVVVLRVGAGPASEGSASGRLRVVGVRVAADLPSRWPSRPSLAGAVPPLEAAGQ